MDDPLGETILKDLTECYGERLRDRHLTNSNVSYDKLFLCLTFDLTSALKQLESC